MQHSPGPAPLGAVLLYQPLARAAELQPRAVHQQVHRRAPCLWSRHLQRLGPAAEGAGIRHREIETEHLQDGADQPLVWRSAKWNTARNVSVVAIARSE